MRPIWIVSAVLLLGRLTVCVAQPLAQFTPPGPNVALHKSYTLEPAPNSPDCANPSDRALLTDGVYTEGYFWAMKTTTSWAFTRPVAITIDLGQVEPIAGLSYNTAAGTAGVTWPVAIRIIVSDDGKLWTALGDLVTLSNKRGAPAATPYALHRYATGDLQARGRYVTLIVDSAVFSLETVEKIQAEP